jgi:prepilin-type N-terminal cleavage/methylation domain-containing protein
MPFPSRHRAFTLIELLVVIAVIAVLVGAVGVALRGGDRGTALQAGQSALSSLIAAARAQAAVRLTNATIVVWGEYDGTKPEVASSYLHRAAIMTHEDTSNPADGIPDAYVVRGDVVDLPRGVYFVPPDLGAGFPAKYEVAADWPDAATLSNGYYRTQSTSTSPVAMEIKRWNGAANSGAGEYEDDTTISATFQGYRTVTFDPQGQLSGAPRSLVIALGDADGEGILFRDSNSQRGLFLSEYGIPTIINDKAGLKEQ